QNQQNEKANTNKVLDDKLSTGNETSGARCVPFCGKDGASSDVGGSKRDSTVLMYLQNENERMNKETFSSEKQKAPEQNKLFPALPPWEVCRLRNETFFLDADPRSQTLESACFLCVYPNVPFVSQENSKCHDPPTPRDNSTSIVCCRKTNAETENADTNR